jgi:hypothetical protein
MDASLLWYPEIVASGPKHKFLSYCMPKVSKVLRNSHMYHFGSNGVEWMLHIFGAPKYCIQARNTSFHLFTCRRLAKCSEILLNIIYGSDRVEWMLRNFGASKLCIQTCNTSLASFTCQRLAKCSVTLPNIILGPME